MPQPETPSGPRVAYFLQAFPQLSETFVENEIRAVRQFGVEVVVLSVYRPPGDLQGPTDVPVDRIFYPPPPVRIFVLWLRWLLRRPRAMLTTLVRALATRSLTMLRGVWLSGWAATVMSQYPDLERLHAHFATDSSCLADSASELTGLPFSLTVHAHEIYLRNNGLCGRADRATPLITVCEYNYEQLRRLCPRLTRDEVPIIYCGVDPQAFRPTPPASPASAAKRGDPLAVLSVGRLVETKAFDLLILAMAELRRLELSVECAIVGAGPLQSDLEILIRKLGLESTVRLLGPRLPGEVAELMAASQLFVLPCRIGADGNRDSMPVAIKEAMAAGLPVVATATAGIPEMVDDDVGRLVPPENPGALASAMYELLSLPEHERLALGARGRQRVEDRFNLWHETSRLLSVLSLRSALGSQRR